MNNDKVKVSFIDTVNNVTLGTCNIPFIAITKLNIDDVIEFKEYGALFGLYQIKSFAVNHGFPEGSINLVPYTPKAKIKLQEVNTAYAESLLPF